MESQQKSGPGCLMITLIVLVTIIVSTALAVWIINSYVFPKRFSPVELSKSEQSKLDKKLDVFSKFGIGAANKDADESNATLKPEKYEEDDNNRTIELSERELNALLANNTDLSEQIAIDLSDKLASAKLLIKPDPDFPVFGGKTIKVAAGLELGYLNEKPIIKLRGVSVMGVPVPNSWLGGIKNVDLVQEFGIDEGFWKSFSEGIDFIQVEDNQLVIRLKE